MHEVRTSECCALLTASAHLGSRHLAAFPNHLTPGPVDYTFRLLPALQRDTFRKKLDRLFGTFQGTSRSADSCWVRARDGPLRRRSERGVWRKRRTGHPDPLQIIGRNKGMISPHAAHVNHGSVVCHLHRLADAGFSSFHHL